MEQYASQQYSAHSQRHSLAEFRSLSSTGRASMAVSSKAWGMNGNVSVNRNHMDHGVRWSGGVEPSRSPPTNRNLSNVPCKFFRQGNCQAGNACPFSHAIEDLSRPCEYFLKGNCKFGQRCGNAHILPDGRRVNAPHPQPWSETLSMGQRILPLQENGSPAASNIIHSHPITPSKLLYSDHYSPPIQQRHRESFPFPEPAYPSPSGARFGSPPAYSSSSNKVQANKSPKYYDIHDDVPLPPNFYNVDASHIARSPDATLAQSVPSRFGFDPLTSTSTTTSTVTSTAFANLNQIARNDSVQKHHINEFRSSLHTERFMPQRIMHSERRSKPIGIAHSLGRHFSLQDVHTDMEDELGFLPQSLHDDLNIGSPPESKDRTSPHNSPSRFGSLFSSMQTKAADSTFGSPLGPSPFGHVGSPLRYSSLNTCDSPVLGPISRPKSGDVSPAVLSPPRSTGTGILLQAFQGTNVEQKLNQGERRSILQPNSTRSVSSPTLLPSGRLGRAVSNSSMNRDRIEEEPCLFSMDEEQEKLRELERKKETEAPGAPR